MLSKDGNSLCCSVELFLNKKYFQVFVMEVYYTAYDPEHHMMIK